MSSNTESILKKCDGCGNDNFFDRLYIKKYKLNNWSLKFYCNKCDQSMYRTYGFNRNDWKQ